MKYGQMWNVSSCFQAFHSVPCVVNQRSAIELEMPCTVFNIYFVWMCECMQNKILYNIIWILQQRAAKQML